MSQPASVRRHTRSTSSPPRRVASKSSVPVTTSVRTSSAALGTKGIGLPGRTGPSCCPRSSDDRTPSKRDERVRRPGRRCHDPGRHGGHQRVVEMTQERTEPPRRRARSRSRRTPRARCWTCLQSRVAGARRPCVGRQPDEPRAVALGDLLGDARLGRGIVDDDAGQAVRARRAAGRAVPAGRAPAPLRSRPAGRTAASTGRGENAPDDTRRRASTCAAFTEPTGAPVRQRASRSRARGAIRKRRKGLPPRSTVPSSKARVEGSRRSTNEPGSGVEARGGA